MSSTTCCPPLMFLGRRGGGAERAVRRQQTVPRCFQRCMPGTLMARRESCGRSRRGAEVRGSSGVCGLSLQAPLRMHQEACGGSLMISWGRKAPTRSTRASTGAAAATSLRGPWLGLPVSSRSGSTSSSSSRRGGSRRGPSGHRRTAAPRQDAPCRRRHEQPLRLPLLLPLPLLAPRQGLLRRRPRPCLAARRAPLLPLQLHPSAQAASHRRRRPRSGPRARRVRRPTAARHCLPRP